MVKKFILHIILIFAVFDCVYSCIGTQPRQYYYPSSQAGYNSTHYYDYNSRRWVPRNRMAGAENIELGEESNMQTLVDNNPSISSSSGASASNGAGFRVAGTKGINSPEPILPYTNSKTLPGVNFYEFDSSTYNEEGGGPINQGQHLNCDFDQGHCCWANVPSPDDQLDWKVGTGNITTSNDMLMPMPGAYLIAHASKTAPSDEGQFASCSIACASSNIKIRVRYWQSKNVLLQVCQRESFPQTIEVNPLLNCQELPSNNYMGYSEVVLPKASLVDIVFVASNFVGEKDDVAVIDKIEVIYENNQNECDKNGKNSYTRVNEFKQKENSKNSKNNNAQSQYKKDSLSELSPENNVLTEDIDMSNVDNTKNNVEGFIVKESKTKNEEKYGVDSLTNFCQRTKCGFEKGNTCYYSDVYTTQSIRGLTTRFTTVSGQYMNRVTGVKESAKGEYYTATFLYPREMAGLQVDIPQLREERSLRFQYYEGTHGVQLKACCDTTDNCNFSSDKFVSVDDRIWKVGKLDCPIGTKRIIFLCENTRTNQGACAIDDIEVVAKDSGVSLSSLGLC
ncbi:MAM domain and Concanavalin A-like lectin/glucanases superfamily domain-containing protein [Strongyloides ratti]|uniref:MAM domain and Concanavalin A-like lectin/glucanases superfamily domain-containing protein n=1 Tax=Strongyloides ratti TaxID=34506 RepID=A0A090KYG4_STRRB|nr:MAM domain and Concanavalin A-like lectin/glucanases superfamily domain-containing protein [Strongyloides ratti]CEF60224.1 MAM domain and Concanavalin A-like lectin/glucanases superfamily domain-containing protein [Strongyloides ratti]